MSKKNPKNAVAIEPVSAHQEASFKLRNEIRAGIEGAGISHDVFMAGYFKAKEAALDRLDFLASEIGYQREVEKNLRMICAQVDKMNRRKSK